MKSTITSIFVCFSMLLMSSPLFAQGEFVTDWDLSLTAGSGTNQIIFFKEVTGADANYTWQEILPSNSTGSGTIPIGAANFTLSGLPAGATIRLSIEPTNLKRFATNNLSDAPRLKDVKEWGTAAWVGMDAAFRGATNMTMSATDVPNLSNVLGMFNMFANASVFNSNISNWNTANVTSMKAMFSNATTFNQPLDSWNTGNVTDMGTMFSGATAFNQPIGTWNTTLVTDMNSMFANAVFFNQPIGNWNTEKVTDMNNMFNTATAFNQPIANWNTVSVTNMSFMLSGANSFNQSIGNWTLNPSVNLSFMLNGSGMDCDNYSNTLIGWEANNPTVTNRTLGASGRRYNSASLTARNSLVSRGWTITSDAACSVLPIEWIDFKAQKQPNGNLLTWNVVATNQDYFDIERSSDNLNFQNIGTVKASDNGKYEYLDNTISNSPINYYRIKAVEHDRTSNYSKIVSVINSDTKTVRLYPNPANNNLFFDNVKEKTNYQIVNTIGLVVLKGITNANNSINIQELKNGIYFLQIEGKTLRFFINKQ